MWNRWCIQMHDQRINTLELVSIGVICNSKKGSFLLHKIQKKFSKAFQKYVPPKSNQNSAFCQYWTHLRMVYSLYSFRIWDKRNSTNHKFMYCIYERPFDNLTNRFFIVSNTRCLLYNVSIYSYILITICIKYEHEHMRIPSYWQVRWIESQGTIYQTNANAEW